jgi:hypothetical protein
LLVIPAKARINLGVAFALAEATAKASTLMPSAQTTNRLRVASDMQRESMESPWIPAFAGMTSESNIKMGPGFRRDDGQRRKASLLSDVRESAKVPGFPPSRE